MAFTAGELASIANAALDFYFNKGSLYKQSVQKKPLISRMEGKASSFSGGKGDIIVTVKGTYGAGGTGDALKGYTHDDTLEFYTPANIDRAAYPWRETHIGMTMTHTELKIDGLSVVDTASGEGTSSHSRREMHVIMGLMKDKVEDIGEQYLRGLNDMLWGDGTADAKGFAGIQSIIVDDPTAAGTVGGIDQVAKTWWRNRSLVGVSAITSTPANGGALMQTMQKEVRQLRRYGNGPDTLLCGSDFLDAMEVEMRANGVYSQNGFADGGDISVGVLRINGVGTLQYDPWLDDNSMAKRCYAIDSRAIKLMKMEGEWKRNHTPARPNDQFVLHRSITSTGQVICGQRNTSGVYEIA